MKKEDQIYVIMCKYDLKDENTNIYYSCENEKQVFHFVTRLGISIHNKTNKKQCEKITLNQLIKAVKTIPFLKVYETNRKDKMENLVATKNFAARFREYIKGIADSMQKLIKGDGSGIKGNSIIKKQMFAHLVKGPRPIKKK